MTRADLIERATTAQRRVNRTRAYAETWLSLIHHYTGRVSLVRDYDRPCAVTLAENLTAGQMALFLDGMAAAIDARDCPAAMTER